MQLCSQVAWAAEEEGGMRSKELWSNMWRRGGEEKASCKEKHQLAKLRAPSLTLSDTRLGQCKDSKISILIWDHEVLGLIQISSLFSLPNHKWGKFWGGAQLMSGSHMQGKCLNLCTVSAPRMSIIM